MPQLRARFYGAEPAGYRELNQALFEGETLVPPPEPAAEPGTIAAYAGLDGLESSVKIIRCPLDLPDKTKTGSIAEMARLGRDGLLTALRGERRTDLARPLSAAASRRVLSTCPHLSTTLETVERFLAGTHLFVRAVKYDRARVSSTDPSVNRSREHLHFDAELSSLEQYDEPVFQFYLNLGREPRQFRILPVPLTEMLSQLIAAGALDPSDRRATQIARILELYRRQFPVELEIIPVESSHLAIFDGRAFAHDAGKANMAALMRGSFEPAAEDDLVLALDTTMTGHHSGLYNPTRPFLEDLKL